MSFKKHVERETKGVCHVRVTASGSLQAILKVDGTIRTKTKKDTQEGADYLIRWINQNYAMLSNRGLIANPETRRPFTVGDVIEWYKNHPTPKRKIKNKLSPMDLSRLNKLARDPMAKTSLADDNLLVRQAHEYVAKRRPSGVDEPTIERAVTLFKAMFNKARRERFEGLPDIPQPWTDIQFDYDPEDHTITRTKLTDQEELMLLKDFEKNLYGLNKIYVPLAFQIGLHTGMRMKTIFELRWKDAKLIETERRIYIRKDKDGKPRTIPMPYPVHFLLLRLAARLLIAGKWPEVYHNNDLIFPPSDRTNKHGKQAENRQNSFSQSFESRVNALGLNEGRERRDRLTFRALRKIASVRFEFEMGMLDHQCKFMLGHTTKKDIRGTHYQSPEDLIKAIQDKLDRYWFKGKSWEEMDEFVKANPEIVQQEKERFEHEVLGYDRTSYGYDARDKAFIAQMNGDEEEYRKQSEKSRRLLATLIPLDKATMEADTSTLTDLCLREAGFKYLNEIPDSKKAIFKRCSGHGISRKLLPDIEKMRKHYGYEPLKD